MESRLSTRKKDRWYHVVCTYSGTAAVKSTEVYIDGARYEQALTNAGTYVGMVPDGSEYLYV